MGKDRDHKAKNRQDKEGMRVLFPVSLVEFSVLNEWSLFNSDG